MSRSVFARLNVLGLKRVRTNRNGTDLGFFFLVVSMGSSRPADVSLASAGQARSRRQRAAAASNDHHLKSLFRPGRNVQRSFLDVLGGRKILPPGSPSLRQFQINASRFTYNQFPKHRALRMLKQLCAASHEAAPGRQAVSSELGLE